MYESEKFRQDRYDEFDAPARIAMCRWLNSIGVYTLSVEDFRADVKAVSFGGDGAVRKSSHELEVRFEWKGGSYPYDTVTIPYRKNKLLDDNCFGLYFWSMTFDCKRGIWVPAHVVKESDVIKKNTKRGVGKFFSVPIGAYKYEDLI